MANEKDSRQAEQLKRLEEEKRKAEDDEEETKRINKELNDDLKVQQIKSGLDAISQQAIGEIIENIRSVLQEIGDAYNELRENILNNSSEGIKLSNQLIKELIKLLLDYEQLYTVHASGNSREEKINELHQLLQDEYNAVAKEALKERYCEQLFDLVTVYHLYADYQNDDNQLEIDRINNEINQKIEDFRTAVKDTRSIDDIKMELDQFAQSALEALKIARDRVRVPPAPRTDNDESHLATIEVANPVAEIAVPASNYKPVSDTSNLLNETLNNLDRIIVLSSKTVDASKNAYEKKKAEFELANSKLKELQAIRDSLVAPMVELNSEKAIKFSPGKVYNESQLMEFMLRYVKVDQQQIENSTALNEVTPQTKKLKEEMSALEKKWLIDSKLSEVYCSLQELLKAKGAGILENEKILAKILSDLQIFHAYSKTDPYAEKLFKQCHAIAQEVLNTYKLHASSPAAKSATREPVVQSPPPTADIATANSLISATTVTPALSPVSIITPTERMQNNNDLSNTTSVLTEKMKPHLFDQYKRQSTGHIQMLNNAAEKKQKIGKNVVNVLQEFIKTLTDAIDDSRRIMTSQDKTDLRAIRAATLAALDNYLVSTKSSAPKMIKHTIIRTARKVHAELSGADKKELSRDELKALSKQYKVKNPVIFSAPKSKAHSVTHGPHKKNT